MAVREKQPLYLASGRLSSAIRHGMPEEEIELRRRELAGAQLERYMNRLLEAGTPPTKEQAQRICKALRDAAA